MDETVVDEHVGHSEHRYTKSLSPAQLKSKPNQLFTIIILPLEPEPILHQNDSTTKGERISIPFQFLQIFFS